MFLQGANPAGWNVLAGRKPCGVEFFKGACMAEIRTQEVDDLLAVLAGTTNPDDVYMLLEDLLTVREIKDASQRLTVARLLDQGKSYSSIERVTGASATTIARVSKALNYGSGGYSAALKMLED